MKLGFRALCVLMINFTKELLTEENNISDSTKARKIPQINSWPWCWTGGSCCHGGFGCSAASWNRINSNPSPRTFFQKSLLRGRGVAEPLSLVASLGLSEVTACTGATASGALGFGLAGGSWEGGTFLSAFTQLAGGCSGLWQWKWH